jgi:hypothetical protein
LISVDLPTFGKPTIATVPAISTIRLDVRRGSVRAGRRRSREVPSRAMRRAPASHSHSLRISRSISTDASL